MGTVLMVFGILVGLLMLFIAWRIYATFAGMRQTAAALAARVAPVAEALEAGGEPNAEQLDGYARNPETRKALYRVLELHGRSDLFPAAFRTWEACAEADLVAWLCHPNELGGPPDEVELTASVPDPAEPALTMFVFRYRTHEPHWAAPRGWLAGWAGPYDTTAPAQPHGRRTFSRFEPYESQTPEGHVARGTGRSAAVPTSHP